MRAEPIAGRYERVEEIGSGGMGQVWRGYDSVLDREVAIKLIRPDAVHTPEQAEELTRRFRREARVTARIQHHGVPQVYDAVLDHSYDRLYLVMEFVRGTTLRAFIDPQQPLPVTWAAAIAAQICTVLSHAHAIPVVHRDLKPDNVLVTADGAVKLLDFGIAAILRTDVTQITATGSALGTHHYMPPEQIQGAQITPQSDLYALGCVLHELFAGQRVFTGSSDFELWRQHVTEPPPPLRTLRPDVPAEIEKLVLDLLAKAPEDRPPEAYDVYEQLLPFLPLPGSAPPGSDAAHSTMPDPTLVYRRPNAPRRRPEPTPVVPTPRSDAAADPAAILRTGVRDAIKAAVAQSDELLDDERFTQAAEILEQVIGPASALLGAESPRVLVLRSRRAAILVIGGDFRRALPEFDALAAAYARTAGPTSEDALECLRQAAHCRAELGHATTALRQFRQVLSHVRAAAGDASPTALDLRRNIGMLLLSEGKATEAGDELRPLYDDLCIVYGPQHEETREVAEVLARLRFAAD
ncbi:serine/threonine-protein kinase [Micromonospora endophytica]|uniref:non-specific serine/threonine protein kinase n=1 Tax=Micromonospora endophytica TaxID=515350 RepID=A0A2W2D6P2_9ACTN|nr:serine/threonine-protein kinase [Micromonospora endophytica]PZG01145.1 serine/threonine protein kinase [Micromonospora endophytica]RIW40734.1 serine/threonine protein kinase [Micromonospora endophytica]BCJ61806.1 protein kinase [Micromonospora endophytica]